MEEKNKGTESKPLELCAITKEFAQRQLQRLMNTPESRVVIDEYFMWVNAINSPVDIVKTEEKPKEPVKAKSK